MFLRIASRHWLPISSLIIALGAHAQSEIKTSISGSVPVATTKLGIDSLTWQTLSPQQQAALAPLAQTWNTLSDGHKRKWIALSANYSGLARAEQETLRSRMGDWASLKPSEREQARLNFAQSKKLPAADRTATWEAYQALSPEDKKKLASAGNAKPTGAAVAIKPVAPEKMASAPEIRKATDARRALGGSSLALNRSTLLPIPAKPASAPSAPATN
jgi:hypothetical protein